MDYGELLDAIMAARTVAELDELRPRLDEHPGESDRNGLYDRMARRRRQLRLTEATAT